MTFQIFEVSHCESIDHALKYIHAKFQGHDIKNGADIAR